VLRTAWLGYGILKCTWPQTKSQGGRLITIQREGLRSFTRAIGALALSTVLVAQTAYAGTYMPECYKAATDNPGNLKYPAKKGLTASRWSTAIPASPGASR
jgi:hypothetical protein